jgi:hypothetical protein
MKPPPKQNSERPPFNLQHHPTAKEGASRQQPGQFHDCPVFISFFGGFLWDGLEI